jgi:pimeloyl-ACP methyl ester carboxylesterase
MARLEHEVLVEGRVIRYLEAGEGAALVLIHGNEDSAGDWQWVLPDLARRHRVLAPDLPGFGGRDRSPGDYSSGGMTRFLDGFLDALGLPAATLVGSSLGGRAVLDHALAHPRRVTALVLVDGAGLGPEIELGSRVQILPGLGESLSFLAMFPAIWPFRMMGRIGASFGCPSRVPFGWMTDQMRLATFPQYYWNSLAAARAQVGIQGQRVVYADRLHELKMPTLLVWGGWDRIIPVAQAMEVVNRFPDGRLEVIPDCGHLPHVECPEAFVAAVETFLESRRPGRGAAPAVRSAPTSGGKSNRPAPADRASAPSG